jgi:hypothetical protein
MFRKGVEWVENEWNAKDTWSYAIETYGKRWYN